MSRPPRDLFREFFRICALGLAPVALLCQASHFGYDRNAPLDAQESGAGSVGGVTVLDLTYASPRGGRVPAYLVIPNGGGPFAAVLFGHWMMQGSPMRNRREFLDEAVVLARAGAMSLLIDSPLVRPAFVADKDPIRSLVQNAQATEQQVVDFRRGVDLLAERGDVDPKRIAYVGHSFDANVGAILAGVEKRIQSFVLMAGSYALEEYVFDPNNAEMSKARARIGEQRIKDYFRDYGWADAVHALGHAAPSLVFLQFGLKDTAISENRARHEYDLFSQPKKIAFYDAGHSLNAAARRDRVRWLVSRLKLKPVAEADLNKIAELK